MRHISLSGTWTGELTEDEIDDIFDRLLTAIEGAGFGNLSAGAIMGDKRIEFDFTVEP